MSITKGNLLRLGLQTGGPQSKYKPSKVGWGGDSSESFVNMNAASVADPLLHYIYANHLADSSSSEQIVVTKLETVSLKGKNYHGFFISFTYIF